MAEVDVLIVPSLRSSAVKAANMLNGNYNVVFLNYPYNLQSSICSYAYGFASLNDLVERIKCGSFIPEPVNSWLYLNEPILEVLQRLRKDVKIFCYKDVDHYHMLADVASKIASLTLRVNITDKVDVDEWIKTLRWSLRTEATDWEAEVVASKAEGKTVCLAGINGWKLAQRIRGFGHKANVKCAERLYCLKPMETFEILLEMGKLTREEAEKLVREHAKFIRDFVLNTCNIDEAYYSWLEKRKIIGLSRKLQVQT
ncbi:hypothetical protein KEJ45_03400 [Candidatus Bathyarchaeota archaeon]|nr:hypothetical protein [Candidatus Bathyarchaeota archaeon]